jgi:phosphoglycerate dehydrogenase-like enzyme
VSKPGVLVTFAPSPGEREAVEATLAPLADLTYLDELPDGRRADAVRAADAVLGLLIGFELREPPELALLHSVGLIQLLSAGVDQVPFAQIPDEVPVASNVGSYSEPMAEHVLAMALALAKRLLQNNAALRRGLFDQQTLNREIRGSLVGVLGFGGIGQASARLFQALGARILAVNRSGRTDEPVEEITTLGRLEEVVSAVDILVISIPLTRSTRGLIGGRELALMKRDAILVNVARAAIIDEQAFYEHLRENPSFSAGIDTWWEEPRGGASFTTRWPFLELPNVIGSPHNSGITAGSLETAARDAAENIARHLRGEPVRHLVDRADYVG